MLYEYLDTIIGISIQLNKILMGYINKNVFSSIILNQNIDTFIEISIRSITPFIKTIKITIFIVMVQYFMQNNIACSIIWHQYINTYGQKYDRSIKT